MPRLTLEKELAALRESVVRMGTLVESQIEAALDALRRRDPEAAEQVRREHHARDIAAHDNEMDRLYHRAFEDLVAEIGNGTDTEGALRAITLLLVAHNLERIADRVTNVAEDIVFLETGQVVELG